MAEWLTSRIPTRRPIDGHLSRDFLHVAAAVSLAPLVAYAAGSRLNDDNCWRKCHGRSVSAVVVTPVIAVAAVVVSVIAHDGLDDPP